MTQNHVHGKYGGQQGPDQSTQSGSVLDDVRSWPSTLPACS
jgi:hypothetical protein